MHILFRGTSVNEDGEKVTSRKPRREKAWPAAPAQSRGGPAPTNLVQPSLLGEDGDVAVISCAAYLDGREGQALKSKPLT